jgi:hypothetical protein
MVCAAAGLGVYVVLKAAVLYLYVLVEAAPTSAPHNMQCPQFVSLGVR